MSEKKFKPINENLKNNLADVLVTIIIGYIQLELAMDDIISKYYSKNGLENEMRDNLISKISYSYKIEIIKQIAKKLDIKDFAKKELERCKKIRDIACHKKYNFDPGIQKIIIESKELEIENPKEDFIKNMILAQKNLTKIGKKMGISIFGGSEDE